MATREKSSVFEVSDDAASRKTKTGRGSRAAGLTRVLGGAAVLLLLLLLLMVVMAYLVYLHVRLSKLEQCPCVGVTTRNWAANDGEGDGGEVIDKVRVAMSDCRTEYLP